MADKVRLTRTDGSGNEIILHPETTSDMVTDFDSAVAEIAGTTESQLYVPVPSTFYYRPSLFTSNKTSITIPVDTAVVVNGRYYRVETATTINIADYYTAANRKGKDVYLYACENSDTSSTIPLFRLSTDGTYPSGFTATTSRKIGGFHCLCADVGTAVASTHPLYGYVAGDLLPASRWDLKHRPECSPEGMVYSDDLHLWVDIYLPSVLSTTNYTLASVFGGNIADGGSTPKFHWYKQAQWMANSGKRMVTQQEFISLSTGSNQGTNITGSTDPGTTGGHKDTSNIRMISNIGCEDCCGCHWQWGLEAGGPYGAASWSDAFDSNDDAGQKGQHYNAPNRALLGGGWSNGADCGSRGSVWNDGPLDLGSNDSCRGVCGSRACV